MKIIFVRKNLVMQVRIYEWENSCGAAGFFCVEMVSFVCSWEPR